MKTSSSMNAIGLFIAASLFSGCVVVKDIFKAGAGVGIFAVLFVLALVGGGIALFRKK